MQFLGQGWQVSEGIAGPDGSVEDADYEVVDEEDKIRMLISPESPYAQAAVWALGRSKDDVIISAALGNAYSGKEGNTSRPCRCSSCMCWVSASTGSITSIFYTPC